MNTFVQAAPAPGPVPAASTYRRTTPTLLQTIGAALWATLEAVGQRRAQRELDLLARRWAPFDPELASRLRQAALRDGQR
jgi:hypothetical protein